MLAACAAAYLTSGRPSVSVRWHPPLSMAIVTHLVTRSFASQSGVALLGLGYPLVRGEAGAYTRPVIALPVWIDDWVYQCCGQTRRVDEAVELELTFEGDIHAATGPDRIDVLDDGQVAIVGMAAGPVPDEHNPTPGTLIACDAVQFAIHGDAPARHVLCTGRLWETRHGWPSGRTRGVLAGIRWHPAIERSTADVGSVIEGYGVGQEQASTDDWRERDDDHGWQAWALELTVKVGGDVARGSHDQAASGQ